MAAISPTQSDVQAALGAFLFAILPGPGNNGSAVFSGFISGNVLTVGRVLRGSVAAGSLVLGAMSGTKIVSQTTGQHGQPGTYQVSISQMTGRESAPLTMSTGVDVLAGQQNRVPETNNPAFVLMTPISFRRLATNVDESQDCKFVGSIAGTLLTVTTLDAGEIAVGNLIFGPGVASGTQVTAFGTGSGGVGTYQVAPAQIVAGETLSAGTKTMTQNAQVTVQCDFHSSGTLAGDLAQTVSTALRDEFGTNFFANLAAPLDGVVPLFGDDPRQIAFTNAENAYEYRWILDVELEVQQIVTVPQLYADSVIPTLYNVSAEFPSG